MEGKAKSIARKKHNKTFFDKVLRDITKQEGVAIFIVGVRETEAGGIKPMLYHEPQAVSLDVIKETLSSALAALSRNDFSKEDHIG